MTPVLAMVLAKPDKTGPKLRPHSEGVPCEANAEASVFPPVCDVYMMNTSPNAGAQAGSRNTSMELLAGALRGIGRTGSSGGGSDRAPRKVRFLDPVCAGNRCAFDAGSDAPAEAPGSSFLEALREQLGLRLEATKAPLQMIVVDHVERPSQN